MITLAWIVGIVVGLCALWYFLGLPVLFAWFAIRWTRWEANTTTDDTLDFLEDRRDHRYTPKEAR